MPIRGSSYIPDTRTVGPRGITGPEGSSGPVGPEGTVGITGTTGAVGVGLSGPTYAYAGYFSPGQTHGNMTGTGNQCGEGLCATADSIIFILTDGSTLGATGFRGATSSSNLATNPFHIENTITGAGSTLGEIFAYRYGRTAYFRGLDIKGDVTVVDDFGHYGITNTILLRGATFGATGGRMGNTGELLFIYASGENSLGPSAYGAANTFYDSSNDTLRIRGAAFREGIYYTAGMLQGNTLQEGNNNVIACNPGIGGNFWDDIVSTVDGNTFGHSIPFIQLYNDTNTIGGGSIVDEGGVCNYDLNQGFTSGFNMGLSGGKSEIYYSKPTTHSEDNIFLSAIKERGSCCYCTDDDAEIGIQSCVDYVNDTYCDAIGGNFSTLPCLHRSEGPFCEVQGGCCLHGLCFPSSEERCNLFGGSFSTTKCEQLNNEGGCPPPCGIDRACCIPDNVGQCQENTQVECEFLGGMWFDQPCDDYICCLNAVPGACCITDWGGDVPSDGGPPPVPVVPEELCSSNGAEGHLSTCCQLSPVECASWGGVFYGVYSSCEDVLCCADPTIEQSGACCVWDQLDSEWNCSMQTEWDCNNVYLGDWHGVNTNCDDIEICYGAFRSTIESNNDASCDPCPSYMIGRYYTELGGYFMGYMGEDGGEDCQYLDELGNPIGCDAGVRGSIRSYGQIKKQIEKHTRDTWKYMPGQEWYDEGCSVSSQMDDDFDFSLWNCDNSNDVTCGWCPMEEHISPHKVYNYSLTNASENVRYLTSLGKGSPKELGGCHPSSECGNEQLSGAKCKRNIEDNQFLHSVWFPYLYSCKNYMDKNLGEWNDMSWTPDIPLYSQSCDYHNEFNFSTYRGGDIRSECSCSIDKSKWLHGVQFESQYELWEKYKEECKTACGNGNSAGTLPGRFACRDNSRFVCNEYQGRPCRHIPLESDCSTTCTCECYAGEGPSSSPTKKFKGHCEGDLLDDERSRSVINNLPSHMLLYSWTDGWKGHPIIPENPYLHFASNIYGTDKLHRRWILVLSPTDIVNSNNDFKLNWGMMQNASIDENGKPIAPVVETTEYDGLLNTRMFDKTSISNNVWFVEGGFNGGGWDNDENADADAYNRWKPYWTSDVVEDTINKSSSSFKSAYETMWGLQNGDDSCISKISDINENSGLMNSGTEFEHSTGFTDWYIPSLSELEHIHWVAKNTSLNSELSLGINNGNHRPMTEEKYWTSTSADRWMIESIFGNVRPPFTNWKEDIVWDGNLGPLNTTIHNTERFENILSGLTPSKEVDVNEIRRSAGNAHRMSCQIFDLWGDKYPYANTNQCGFDSDSMCKGMVETPLREEYAASLRPVRRVLVYSADAFTWQRSWNPQKEICRHEYKTTKQNWPNSDTKDNGMCGCQ